MSFTTVSTAEIAVGEPVKKDLLQKVKDDLDDLNSRTTVVESAISAFLPIEFGVWGNYASGGSNQTNVLVERITFNMTLLGARLYIKTAGTSSTTDVDIQLKRGAGAYATIFSTRPSVAFGSGDNAVSTNAVFSTTSLLAGDLLRLDIITAQQASNTFLLQLEYQKA
jgi:hypothetical protein